MVRARRTTRSEDITRGIADDIIHGRLAPGAALDEHALAERFGTSRLPVREALNQLCASGLAEQSDGCGIVVATLAADRLRDMFALMAELEASAARLAALHMTPAERRTLEDLHLASREIVRRGAQDAYAAYNTNFHSMIYAGGHNLYLEELLTATRKRLNPFRRAQFNMLGRLAASHGEHDAVVQAILRGDGNAAADAMRSHVLTVGVASAEYVGSHVAAGSDPDAANED